MLVVVFVGCRRRPCVVLETGRDWLRSDVVFWVLVDMGLGALVGVYVIRATLSPRYESMKTAVWKL